MRRRLVFLVIFGLLALPILGQAEEFDLETYFPDLTLGHDPEGDLDTVYVACGTSSATEITLQIRMKTDNAAVSDFSHDNGIVAFYIPIVITTDAPGVILDSVDFSGSNLSPYFGTGVNIVSGGGNPSIFPMQLIVGGIASNLTGGVGPGDFLLASLIFTVSEPTTICVPAPFSYYLGDLLLVTEFANGYTPAFVSACCSGGPVVPTLTEWGLIFFGFLLLIGLVWYVRNRRVAARV